MSRSHTPSHGKGRRGGTAMIVWIAAAIAVVVIGGVAGAVTLTSGQPRDRSGRRRGPLHLVHNRASSRDHATAAGHRVDRGGRHHRSTPPRKDGAAAARISSSVSSNRWAICSISGRCSSQVALPMPSTKAAFPRTAKYSRVR